MSTTKEEKTEWSIERLKAGRPPFLYCTYSFKEEAEKSIETVRLNNPHFKYRIVEVSTVTTRRVVG